jgi:hypothetical protein
MELDGLELIGLTLSQRWQVAPMQRLGDKRGGLKNASNSRGIGGGG